MPNKKDDQIPHFSGDESGRGEIPRDRFLTIERIAWHLFKGPRSVRDGLKALKVPITRIVQGGEVVYTNHLLGQGEADEN